MRTGKTRRAPLARASCRWPRRAVHADLSRRTSNFSCWAATAALAASSSARRSHFACSRASVATTRPCGSSSAA
jgi:hypothetical protein